MVEVREYLDPAGTSPFAEWFNGLNAQAAAKVATVLTRIGLGNFSNVKGVGGGVYEYKLDFGPGYRIYFGKDGEILVILLGGGVRSGRTKTLTTQSQDGRTTSAGRSKRNPNAINQRFQRNSPRTGAT